MNMSVCSWIRNIYILYFTSVWKRKDTSSTPIRGSLCSFALFEGRVFRGGSTAIYPIKVVE